MENILKLLLDQLYKNESNLKPIHLAVAAEQKLRDVCLYIKGFVPDSACSDSSKEYLTTLDGYSLTIDQDGDKIWKLNNTYHREGEPAIEYSRGDKQWYLNGKSQGRWTREIC